MSIYAAQDLFNWLAESFNSTPCCQLHQMTYTANVDKAWLNCLNPAGHRVVPPLHDTGVVTIESHHFLPFNVSLAKNQNTNLQVSGQPLKSIVIYMDSRDFLFIYLSTVSRDLNRFSAVPILHTGMCRNLVTTSPVCSSKTLASITNSFSALLVVPSSHSRPKGFWHRRETSLSSSGAMAPVK